eukprot:8822701-Alexandrium_andersonii.AAC.1
MGFGCFSPGGPETTVPLLERVGWQRATRCALAWLAGFDQWRAVVRDIAENERSLPVSRMLERKLPSAC